MTLRSHVEPTFFEVQRVLGPLDNVVFAIETENTREAALYRETVKADVVLRREWGRVDVHSAFMIRDPDARDRYIICLPGRIWTTIFSVNWFMFYAALLRLSRELGFTFGPVQIGGTGNVEVDEDVMYVLERAADAIEEIAVQFALLRYLAQSRAEEKLVEDYKLIVQIRYKARAGEWLYIAEVFSKNLSEPCAAFLKELARNLSKFYQRIGSYIESHLEVAAARLSRWFTSVAQLTELLNRLAKILVPKRLGGCTVALEYTATMQDGVYVISPVFTLCKP